jgi:hypothetical protein
MNLIRIEDGTTIKVPLTGNRVRDYLKGRADMLATLKERGHFCGPGCDAGGSYCVDCPVQGPPRDHDIKGTLVFIPDDPA